MKAAGCSLLLMLVFFQGNAQIPDSIYKSYVHTVRLHMYGDQESLPVYNLSGADKLELHFDDLDRNYKSYYYTFQLCNYDWTPNERLNAFDYMKGFTQMRINSYRNSSLAYTRYTHYQVILPETNCVPTKSGNYIFKVFLDGDTSKLVFTRRMLVLEQKALLGARVVQPFAPQFFNTHQKIIFTADIKQIDAFSAGQQVKAVVLQNNRWDNAARDIQPTFIRGTTLEYNTENGLVFPAGKEWRWLDLRSFMLFGDRIDHGEYKKSAATMYVMPDVDISGQKYRYYRDVNGQYLSISYENINPYLQGEYAQVYFTYAPPNGVAYTGKQLYLFGQMTDYKLNDSSRMVFNPEKKVYEGHLFLKQGYYSYGYYITDDAGNPFPNLLEGNYYDAENSYTVLIYYRGFTDRYDQLIAVSKIDSKTDRPGFSF